MFEDVYNTTYCQVSGAQTNSDTTIEVKGAGASSATIFTVGDLVKNGRTGEIIYVSAVGTTSFTAGTRGSYGTTAAAAMVDGDGLFLVGNVNAENGASRNSNVTRATKQTNYTF